MYILSAYKGLLHVYLILCLLFVNMYKYSNYKQRNLFAESNP